MQELILTHLQSDQKRQPWLQDKVPDFFFLSPFF